MEGSTVKVMEGSTVKVMKGLLEEGSLEVLAVKSY